jgi:hypothetical protein
VVVVGGGAAGLSAAWWLLRRGYRDFAVLELAREPGGNARSGENAVSAYPWGAHYVPVPGPRAEHLRLLLAEMGVLGADGRWRERDLAFAPKERVHLHGRWREGLEEAVAVSPHDRAELARLAERAAELRAGGAFTIPLALGAPADHPLDRLTAAAWLEREGFRSPAAHWLVDYACRDDFGTAARDASAWAALHYFAARDAGDAADEGPLTWPEGNGRLVRWLAARAAPYLHAGAAVRRVEPAGPGPGAPMRVVAGDTEWTCDAVVWAAPTFVAAHVVAGAPRCRGATRRGWSPTSRSPAAPTRPTPTATRPRRGTTSSPARRRSATWWRRTSTCGRRTTGARCGPGTTRRAAATRRRSVGAWRDVLAACADLALDDLARAHPAVRDAAERVDVMRYGHAMPRPEPGFLARHRPWWDPPRDARVFWANSDVSGLSLFEEAQDRGVRAAERALALAGRGA